ncbi:MAG: GNAT family N-acetyltransferase [Rhizobiaceae bacterium]
MEDVAAIFSDCSYARKCWCAYWYKPNRDYKAGWGNANRAGLEQLVQDGLEPGIIAYVDGEAAAWLSIAPRRQFDRLNRSNSLAPVDDEPVWSMNCFVVKKAYRKMGMMRALIAGGIDFARQKGGKVLEAYPLDAQRKVLADELFVGTLAAFADMGFVEAARRLPTRPIMRLRLD